MALWHATQARNLPSILEHGLVPAIGPRSHAAGELSPATYAFRCLADLEQALLTWLGDCFDEDEALCFVEFTHHGEIEHEAFEARLFEVVPPRCILDVYDEGMKRIQLRF